MRRIYDSDALKRDDEDSFSPRERRRETEPQSFRSIDATAWSDRLVPHVLRCWAVSVRVETPRREFQQGETIPFRVTMKNSLPIPVTVRTATPVLWSWRVDGYEEASHVTLRDPPEETAKLQFDRGETIRFNREWSQMFQVSKREWEPAEPGEYTLRAEINVDSERTQLADETTVEIRP